MKALTLWLAVLVGLAGCASTRYEEYGPPIEEPLELPLPQVEDALEPAATGGSPDTRLARLEAMLAERLDRLEAANREQATRVAALSEQVEGLRAQVAALKRPGSGSPPQGSRLPGSSPGEKPAPSVPTRITTDLYDDGLTAFDAQQYAPAREAFRAVLAQNPRGDLADNAQYWLGECDYAEENYTAAIVAFRRVFDFAQTEKDDDAQIKLGYCYHRLGDTDSALIEFKRLTVDYPKSEYLRRAEEQIRRIRAAKATSP